MANFPSNFHIYNGSFSGQDQHKILITHQNIIKFKKKFKQNFPTIILPTKKLLNLKRNLSSALHNSAFYLPDIG